MCLFWGSKSLFMAKHPPGAAVKCYRILVFMCFGSPSYGVGGEGDARVQHSAACAPVSSSLCAPAFG